MDKQTLREDTWTALEDQEVARFPFPPHGRIPNFAGADTAADRLASTTAWKTAAAIKANPDAPQRPVRERALATGKVVYMAVPRLQAEKCFLRLDPTTIDDPAEAATLSGADEYAEPVAPAELEHIDFIVVGSVAIDERGVRVGKGEGYSDLEYAILREADRVDEQTCVATTVHELQLVDEPLEPDTHDVPIDTIATPERLIETGHSFDPPECIEWSKLNEDDRTEMPILAKLYRD